MKRRDVEIVQKDGKFIVLLARSPIEEVAIDLGFTSAKMLSKDFQLFYGVRPTDLPRKPFELAYNANA